MIPVGAALDHLFALVSPLPAETVSLTGASGRVLAEDAIACRDQPPFAASSMDGYAVQATEVEPDALFKVIGESAAGHRFSGRVGPGQAVRIFTGAPMPEGADYIVLQEDVTRQGDLITLGPGVADGGSNVRPAGEDFAAGDRLAAPRLLSPHDIALLAAMNQPNLRVTRRPVVALIPTGDELVQPGEDPGPDQIIASNSHGLAALVAQHGGHPRLLPIARDSAASLRHAFEMARDADLIVTIGGASVGDHDLVGSVTEDLGMERAFYKVAMRPGKPLMAGRIGDTPMVGLPGNPVSAMVCGMVFLLPMLRVMQGLPAAPAPRISARLAHDQPANGPREHYMRARLENGEVRVFERQASSLLTVLADANALVIRPPHDGTRKAGEEVELIRL